jgi:type II secretory pathway component GspD/PulD (secretin)
MTLSASPRLRWLALLLCSLAAAVGAQSLEVIELRHRRAEELIPVLQPLLEPGGALTGQDYKLFVRASAANVAQLRQALAQLDRQPRQLFVSVRRSTQQEIEREGASVAATARSGDAAAAVNEAPRSSSGVTVRATDDSMNDRSVGVASVQVLEGNAAFISSGTSVPIVTAVAGGGGRRPWAAAATSYRNIGSGFLVTPRVANTDVVLEIEQQDEQLRNGNIQTQNLSTQVRGPIGTWIALGDISESSRSTRSGTLSREYATRADQRSIWIKVELR